MKEQANELTGRVLALIEAYEGQTREQHALLTAEEVDAQALNDGLARRRVTLEQLEQIHRQWAEGGPDEAERLAVRARLEAAQALDSENMALAGKQMEALRGQARQMTQNRRGVSSYGRGDLAGETSQLFDKKQ